MKTDQPMKRLDEIRPPKDRRPHCPTCYGVTQYDVITLQGEQYYVEFCPYCGKKWNPEVVKYSKLRSIAEQRLAAERGEPLAERPFKKE